MKLHLFLRNFNVVQNVAKTKHNYISRVLIFLIYYRIKWDVPYRQHLILFESPYTCTENNQQKLYNI